MEKPYLIPGTSAKDFLAYRKVRCETCEGSGKVEASVGFEQGPDLARCPTCAGDQTLEVPICLHCLRPSWPLIADLYSQELARKMHDCWGPLCVSDCPLGDRGSVANLPIVLSESDHRALVDWLYDHSELFYARPNHPARKLLDALESQEVKK